MMELTIFGRGGQGGVTLAKLIATAWFLRGKYAQSFGVYAAERSGAPLQAYVRVDEQEISNHNQVRNPDHVVVLDRTLIGAHVRTGLKGGGWIILNTPQMPEAFSGLFAGYPVGTVDATRIALDYGLGTRAVPIVNTTMLGAVLGVLGLELGDVEAALAHTRFGGANLEAARRAFEEVRTQRLPGTPVEVRAAGAPATRRSLFDEQIGGMPALRTGTWASSVPRRRRLTPPCNHGCPAGNDVRGFVQATARGEYSAALELILQTSPLPGICGRVCPAPCMEACNRSSLDEPVNVRELERYVSEHGSWPHPTAPWREERVAVVGSGPAGLSAAYHLARLGYQVTLFEREREPGGVMRTGIPEYRLPRDVLDREVSFILRHGIELRSGQKVDRARLLRMTHSYAAVFVATGLQEAQSLDLGPQVAECIEEGIRFLDRARRHEVSLGGLEVAVVGGGNTAVDAARTALRVGARTVQIIYRRTRAEMPAIREEIDEALEEGVVLEELVAPLRLRSRAGGGAVLTCQRMRLGEPDESGRRRPIPLASEDGQFDIHCDLVILALGQSRDLTVLPEGADIREDGALLGLAGGPVFLGGDFATNEGTVAAAIGSGRRAALHIHRTLMGEDLFPSPPEPLAGPTEIRMHVFSHVPQEPTLALPPAYRRRNFDEVRLGLIDAPGHMAAVVEAQRCFSCGVCNECDRCQNYCPEGVLVRDGEGGYRFDLEYCKGCGVCAMQCPRGVIYMAEL